MFSIRVNLGGPKKGRLLEAWESQPWELGEMSIAGTGKEQACILKLHTALESVCLGHTLEVLVRDFLAPLLWGLWQGTLAP